MIHIDTLPARAEALTPGALSRVFGGCRHYGACAADAECCGSLICADTTPAWWAEPNDPFADRCRDPADA